MTPKQFDICLDFHLGLIRCTPLDKTIDDARNLALGLVDTVRIASAEHSLCGALKNRMAALTIWDKSIGEAPKIGVYNLNNTRNPSPGAFAAAFDVINGRSGISLAARLNKVNYQSVKVLIPRLQRWDEFAKKLAKTL